MIFKAVEVVFYSWMVLLFSIQSPLWAQEQIYTPTPTPVLTPTVTPSIGGEVGFQNKMSKIRNECQILNDPAQKVLCYRKGCDLLSDEEKVRCGAYSCDEAGFDSLEKQKCAVATINSATQELSDSDYLTSIVDNYPTLYGMISMGNIFLSIIDFVLKRTILQYQSGCVFLSAVLGTVGAVVSNVLNLTALGIYIKGSRDIQSKFSGVAGDGDIQKKSFEYIKYKINIVKQHVRLSLIRYSIALGFTAMALIMAIKEISMGGGYCPPVPATQAANNLFFFIQSAYAVDEDGYSSPVYEDTKDDEGFLAQMAKTVGVEPSTIGKLVLYGQGLITIIMLIYNLYVLAAKRIMPVFNGTWMAGAKEKNIAIGRAVLFSVHLIVTTALVVLTAIILRKLSNREKLLDDIQKMMEKNFPTPSAQKIETTYLIRSTDIFLDNIIQRAMAESNIVQGQSDMQFVKKLENSEPEFNICVNKKYVIDIRCLCKKNRSCLQVDVGEIKRNFGIPGARLVAHINESISGKRGIFNYPQNQINQLNLQLAPVTVKAFAMAVPQLGKKRLEGTNSIDGFALMKVKKLPFEKIINTAPFLQLTEPYIYTKKLGLPKNFIETVKNNPQLNDFYQNMDISYSQTDKKINFIEKKFFPGNDVGENLNNLESIDESYEIDSIEKDQLRNIWDIISYRYLKHYINELK